MVAVSMATCKAGAVEKDHDAVKRFELGGQELTLLLAKELEKTHPKILLDLSTIEQLKELYGSVVEDHTFYSDSAIDCNPVELTLPDGQVISIGRERLTVGEALFQPSLLGVEDYNIVEQMLLNVSCCLPPENQRQLVENIVLCGGTSTMSRFEARFQKEASLLGTPSLRPSLIKPPEYMLENTMRYLAWMGGAILAKVVFPQKSTHNEG